VTYIFTSAFFQSLLRPSYRRDVVRRLNAGPEMYVSAQFGSAVVATATIAKPSSKIIWARPIDRAAGQLGEAVNG